MFIAAVLGTMKRQPDGGNGGRGGDVFLQADPNVSSLNFPTTVFKGGDGIQGKSELVRGWSWDLAARERSSLDPAPAQSATSMGGRARTSSCACQSALS